MPRLVATDLDGTLVRTDGTVSPLAHDVIAALDERGIPVVFVTGRPLRWAEEVFEYVGAHGLAVVSNGALVWDVVRDEIHQTVRGDRGASAWRSCRLIREAVPGSVFAIETVDGIALEPDFMERHPVPAGSARRRRSTRSSTSPRSRCWLGTRRSNRRCSGTGLAPRSGTLAVIDLVRRPRAARDQRGGRDQGVDAGAGVRRAGGRAGGCRGVRRHAQRPPDAGVGRHVVRHGERPPDGDRGRRPRGAVQRRRRGGDRAGWAFDL